jgi:hypothetical protein
MAEKKGLRKKKKNNQKESDSVENETLETNSEEEKSLDSVKCEINRRQMILLSAKEMNLLMPNIAQIFGKKTHNDTTY